MIGRRNCVDHIEWLQGLWKLWKKEGPRNALNQRKLQSYKGDSLFTSWQYHIGLLQTVTKDKFCCLFIHTTDTSVTLTHVTAVK